MKVDINANLKALGIGWRLDDAQKAVSEDGFQIAPNFMGVGRPYYDNILFGSSTFCVSHCKLVGKHSITDGSAGGSELWVFEIPQHIYDDAAPHIKGLTKYLCLPINVEDPWTFYDYNPVPLASIKDAERYRKGWH